MLWIIKTILLIHVYFSRLMKLWNEILNHYRCCFIEQFKALHFENTEIMQVSVLLMLMYMILLYHIFSEIQVG